PTYPTIQRNNPFRDPDWRWRRACQLVEQCRRLLPHRDDAETIQAARYERARRGCRTGRQAARVAEAHHDVHAALQLYEQAGSRRLEVQGRLLAGQRPGEVAERTALPVGVIDRYEALFFNVRPFLRARDWISLQAIKRWDAHADLRSVCD